MSIQELGNGGVIRSCQRMARVKRTTHDFGARACRSDAVRNSPCRKNKWTNPESTNARRNRFRVTDEEPEYFGDDALPRPPGLQRLANSQRSGSNSTASSGSNPMMYREFMKEQYELDRKEKMQVIEQESDERRQSMLKGLRRR
uniref:Uncharacterized protein n=1 Tax=Tanacetum cinerariifolium TaxID=118510 RepID=A0A6L2M2S1_TANCI|nr:hypothetical protein [Tanacetum cinerariifolium]